MKLQAQVNIIQTIAGTDSAGFSGDGGPATNARLNVDEFICLDNRGSTFISDAFNNAIRKVNLSTGIITTITGKDSSGFSGDGGQATNAKLAIPEGIFTDSAGNVYIADGGNNRIRKITVATGIITTIAGSGSIGVGAGGDIGDGGPATDAQMNGPVGLCLDKSGNIYVTDYGNDKVRRVDAITHIMTTFAGIGTSGYYAGGFVGYTGDGGPATAAQFSGPIAVFADTNDNIFICDQWNHAIRKVDAATGIITTVAGHGTAGYTGDGGLAKYATLNQPCGVYVDKHENIYIAEYGDGVIRRVDGATGIISTVAGTGTRGFSGDGGPATAAEMTCGDVFLDSNGIVYIADEDNNRVRVVYNDKLSVSPGLSMGAVAMYPNPAKDEVMISNAAGSEVRIYDVLGQQMMNTTIISDKASINIKALPGGVYMVVIEDKAAGNKVVQRLIKAE